MRSVDLFSGPGGARVGAHRAAPALQSVGIDFDTRACETSEAAGFCQIQADLMTYRPSDFLLFDPEYLHASPPCGGFTLNGKGAGRQDIPGMLEVAGLPRRDISSGIDGFSLVSRDPRSSLSLEPLRWIAELMPRLVSLEQVPAVLPLWWAYARSMSSWGYHVEVRYVNAEEYVAPQVRKRAVLRASLSDGLRPVQQTHSHYYKHCPSKLDDNVPRWVTMAEGLNWQPGHPLRVNNQTQQDFDLTWPWRRPSLAVTGGRIVPMPGDYRKRSKNDGVIITTEEAAALQTFPEKYPFCGSEPEIRLQIGNAVPSVLGEAVVRSLL